MAVQKKKAATPKTAKKTSSAKTKPKMGGSYVGGLSEEARQAKQGRYAAYSSTLKQFRAAPGAKSPTEGRTPISAYIFQEANRMAEQAGHPPKKKPSTARRILSGTGVLAGASKTKKKGK